MVTIKRVPDRALHLPEGFRPARGLWPKLPRQLLLACIQISPLCLQRRRKPERAGITTVLRSEAGEGDKARFLETAAGG
ncbi:hypothetical protein OPV22_020661 [Ensete ventricosum]|uniref:Uncharacterized protein n=1 Tax=Ensete ventricosum TaxID=4639 RepID=A0AAV8QQA7_ENSVE|nr:hypothetical protein OPV22_020661 [Ensete ventricosum]